MMIAHIVAAAKNGVIGKEGDLPWHIPEDLRFFRDRTKGTAMIMGRKTFEAVEHPLPNRLNCVVTRDKNYQPKSWGDEKTPVKVFHTIEDALLYCKEVAPQFKNEIFIIGGGEIYSQSFHVVDTLFITRIHKDYPGDAKYPEPDPQYFKKMESIDRTDPEAFSFEKWVRVKPH